MNKRVIETSIRLPIYWASYLVNNDDSSLDLYEKITVEGTLKSLGIKGECIDVKDDIHFEKPFIPGLLPGDFCTYIFQYHI